MNVKTYIDWTANDPLDCLGEYNKNAPLCTTHCAIRLRCAIELNNNIRIEILEELMASEESTVILQ